NRLHINMPLAADPTIKFALGDFNIKRILLEDLKVPSPYNTYINKGLPPGPICTPDSATIEAVLHAVKTNYLYFVAKPDFSGYHNFSADYPTHLAFAKLYQQALDENNIK
ncbi:MAG TPA: endolytic transglycosylase MltG, partial [Arachidicoccus sp.]